VTTEDRDLVTAWLVSRRGMSLDEAERAAGCMTPGQFQHILGVARLDQFRRDEYREPHRSDYDPLPI
jgi:hypothetical protein